MRLGSEIAFATRRPFASTAAGLCLLAGLIALDGLVFREALGRAYVAWYVENGALLSLSLGLVTVGWPDLNDLRNLPIASQPNRLPANRPGTEGEDLPAAAVSPAVSPAGCVLA